MAHEPRSEEQEREQDGIKVVDRRHFTSAGERRPGMEEDESEASAATPEPGPGREQRGDAAPGPEAGFEHHPVNEPHGVDFTMLINAMAQPALLFLGEIPQPGSDEPTVDLTSARLQIDMLDLLRVKCRGNLTAQEEGLLERVLYQLRMLYVSRSGQPG